MAGVRGVVGPVGLPLAVDIPVLAMVLAAVALAVVVIMIRRPGGMMMMMLVISLSPHNRRYSQRWKHSRMRWWAPANLGSPWAVPTMDASGGVVELRRGRGARRSRDEGRRRRSGAARFGAGRSGNGRRNDARLKMLCFFSFSLAVCLLVCCFAVLCSCCIVVCCGLFVSSGAEANPCREAQCPGAV